MLLQLNDNISIPIASMDRNLFETGINVIIQSNQSIPIDELLQMKIANNNKFYFIVGEQEFEDYQLNNVSEHYDSSTEEIMSTINFSKQL